MAEAELYGLTDEQAELMFAERVLLLAEIEGREKASLMNASQLRRLARVEDAVASEPFDETIVDPTGFFTEWRRLLYAGPKERTAADDARFEAMLDYAGSCWKNGEEIFELVFDESLPGSPTNWRTYYPLEKETT